MDDQSVGMPAALALFVIGASVRWFGDSHAMRQAVTGGLFLIVAGVVCGVVVAAKR